jgi:DNA repair exonuclease SbcCD ATPase subunit
MIQIKAIRIEEFRGIRELELDLGCKSFVVWGPNGSGKSGVVDAIDFALTGSVARLTGAGTAGISVREHGPHVHKRNNAAAARVVLTVRDTVTGQEAELTRGVKTAGQFALSPDTPAMRAAVERAQGHPELVLSRREIIKFIIAQATERAKEVQALLKLDRLDQIRRVLRSAMTKTTGEFNTAAGELKGAEEAMQRHLDLPQLLASQVAAEINKRRCTLGLMDLVDVTKDSDLTDGLGDVDGTVIFDKAGAIREVTALVDAVADPARLTASTAGLVTTLDEIAASLLRGWNSWRTQPALFAT